MKNHKDIRCEWLSKNKGLVNIDGQVYPCCWLANSFTLRSIFGNNVKEDYPDEMVYGGRNWKKSEETELDKKIHLADEYFKHKDELNLHNNSLEDIFNHDWFIKTLPESWHNEENTHRLCSKYCSVESEHNKINKLKPRNEDGSAQ